MRLIFISILSLLLSSLYAQNIDSLKITYKSEDTSIKDIIIGLEQQYGIRFSYATSSWMDSNMDVDFDGQNLDNVLDYLLSDQNIEFKKVNNNILLRKSASYTEVNNEAYKSSLHLKGKVKTDIDEMGTIAFATIMIKNTTIGTYTDNNGEFDLEIPDEYGDQEIIVSYVGLEDAIYKISELQDEYILLNLNKQAFSIEEVIIKNRKKPIRILGENNATTLSNTQIKSQISGVMGSDINRSIQLLPGITAHDDDSSEIKIRGSNSDETLMILDGMPIYNTDHYYGIFSGINAAYVDSVNIYKNTYPIQYGGKTAGVVELFSNNRSVSKAESQIGIDLLTISGQTKIPLSKISTIRIAGRMTPFGVNNNQFNVISEMNDDNVTVSNFGRRIEGNKSDPNFNFYDFNANYTYNDTNDLSVKLNLYRSHDEFTNDNKIDIKDDRQDKVDIILNQRQKWTTTASSVMWTQPLSESIKLNTRAHYTNYQNVNKNDIEIEKKLSHGNGFPSPQNPDGTILGATHQNKVTDYGLDTYIHIPVDNHSLTLGALAIQQDIDYLFSENRENKLSGRNTYQSYGGYSSFTYNPSTKLSLTGGLRASYYNNLKQPYLSPRFLMSYKINDKLNLKGSYSYVQQIIRQLYYEYRSEPLELWVGAGQNNIPVLTSQNMMLGTTLKIGSITLDIEAYQKVMDGTIEYAVIDPTNNNNNPNAAEDYQLFFGEGLVRGLDVIASFGYKKYDSYISYTLSKSQERYKEIYKNRYYASENDRRHQLKWVNTLSFGSWTFDINGIYSSGRPYTNAEQKDNNGDIRDAEPSDRLRRLPAYQRVDFGCSRKLKVANQNLTLSFSVFNLLNTENVKYIQSVSTQLIANQIPVNTVIDSESTLLNRTFNVGAKLDF